MKEEVNLTKQEAQELYDILRRHLLKSDEGRQIIVAFEADPEKEGDALSTYLRQQLTENEELAIQLAGILGDGEQITTIVSGGVVDQIINIQTLEGGLTVGDVDGNLTIGRVDILRRSIFGSVGQVVTVILFALAIITGVASGVWYFRQPDKMPEEEFNIAVAKFGQIADGEIKTSSEATDISNVLFNFMDSEFDAMDFGLKVNVSRKNMPLVQGNEDAEKLVAKTNADIVIYGQVDLFDESAADFLPRFYVAENPDTNEITGQSELAYPIEFEIPVRPQDEVNELLRKRASILINFTQGLVYLSADDLESASQMFKAAAKEAEGHGNFDGQEVLYLLLGTTMRVQGDLESAEEYFDKALEINPDYARARIGKGNIHYVQYIQNYEDNFAEEALAEYNKAIELEKEEHQEGAYIPEKSNVSLGNIYVVQAQSKGDPALFEKAIGHYSQVTKRYEKIKNDEEMEQVRERIKGLAATAYFGLGAAYERQDDFERAVEGYCSAIELSDKKDFIDRAQGQLDIIGGACQ